MTTEMKTIGAGEFTYEVAVDWETLPPGYAWQEASAVAVNAKDEVYVYNRSDHPIIVFDSDGKYLRDWGDPTMYPRAHGITFAPDGTLFLVDDGDHTVRKCTPEGKVIFTLGTPGLPSEYMSGQPFHRPTDVAIDPNTGEFYVADGYGNSRVHKYSPDGVLLFSWGEPGVDPGQFNITHNIATDVDGYLYVADRENHRVQIFDSKGNYETQWKDMHRPCALYVSADQHIFVGELGAGMNVNRHMPNIGPWISVYNRSGERLARIGEGFGEGPGQFVAPHDITMDSMGNLYVGEVAWTNMKNFGEIRDGVRSLQKLLKVQSVG